MKTAYYVPSGDFFLEIQEFKNPDKPGEPVTAALVKGFLKGNKENFKLYEDLMKRISSIKEGGNDVILIEREHIYYIEEPNDLLKEIL